jgi:hypothetical protein
MKTFTMTMLLAVIAVSGRMCVAHGGGSAGEASSRDQLRMAVQEICPVSGDQLDPEGEPIRVIIGEAKEEVFLCCPGCAKGKIKPEHWATIHANIANAQGVCPIMKKELPKGAKWTIVSGQVVYVCCPPCIKKIVAKPEDSLKQVDGYYTAYLKAKREAR